MAESDYVRKLVGKHGEVFAWIVEMSAMPKSMVWNMCGGLTGVEMEQLLRRWERAGLVKTATIGTVRWVWCTTYGNEIAGAAPYRDEIPPTETTWRHLRAVCLVRAAIESMGGEWMSGRYLRWESEHRAPAPTRPRTPTQKTGRTPNGAPPGPLTYPDGLAWLVPRSTGTGWPWLVRVNLNANLNANLNSSSSSDPSSDPSSNSKATPGWDEDWTALIATGTALTSSEKFCVLYVVSDNSYGLAEASLETRPDRDRFQLQRLSELAPLGKQWFRTRTSSTNWNPRTGTRQPDR
ncbi:hypothetical protein [Pseudonocardia sp. Ae505_Ps2]|uniref:hypothetical protein n=1 Tax=Pseudonocardia sp. Ae505_Ps2 TaxID=1885034 RepID=UPI000966CF7C|nr:hypothetical protein [Pseudonocardia sp. Ae505_Ps2]OLM08422.1 hypothetical protein Ae505Ps2_6128 [Pseudonocardia sp. Ae505_Ps2]